MNNDNYKWLQQEMPQWIQKGWLGEAQAKELVDYYRAEETRKPSRTHFILVVVGSCLLAAAVILILQNNWHRLSLVHKTLLAISVLLFSQILNFWVLWKKSADMYKEGAAIFHVGAVFASVGMVGNIYNANSNFADYLLTCGLLVLPIAYLLRSTGAIIIYMLACAYWSTNTRAIVGSWGMGIFKYPETVWLLFAFAVPWHYTFLKRDYSQSHLSVKWLGWSVALSLYIGFASTVSQHYRVELMAWSLFAGLLLLLSNATSYGAYFSPLQKFSKVAMIVVLLAASFDDVLLRMLKASDAQISLMLVLSVFFVGLYYMSWDKMGRMDKVLCGVPLVLGIVSGALYAGLNVAVATLVITLYGVWTAFYITSYGLQNHSLHYTNMGLVVLLLLGTCRFFDENFSYITKGISFAVLGVLVIVLNVYLLRKQKNSPAVESHAELEVPTDEQ